MGRKTWTRATRLELYGETKTVAEWAADRRSAVDLDELIKRLDAGIPPHDALVKPFSNLKLSPAAFRHRGRAPIILTAWGETKAYSDWKDDPRCVVKNVTTLQTRLRLGWSHEAAMSKPVRKITPFINRRLTAFGFRLTVRDWLTHERCVADYQCLIRRILKENWKPETALSTPMGPTIPPRYIEAFGETKRLCDWEKDARCNVSANQIKLRLARGWRPEDAIGQPPLELGDRMYEDCESFREETFQGETKRLRDWLNDPRCQVDRATFYVRLQNGYPFEAALTLPLMVSGTNPGVESFTARRFTAFGETKSFSEWARDPRCPVKETTLRQRLLSGWSLEEAFSAAAGNRLRYTRIRSRTATAWGETRSTYDWSHDPRCIVERTTLVARLQQGWEPEEAMTTPFGVTRTSRRRQAA